MTIRSEEFSNTLFCSRNRGGMRLQGLCDGTKLKAKNHQAIPGQSSKQRSPRSHVITADREPVPPFLGSGFFLSRNLLL